MIEFLAFSDHHAHNFAYGSTRKPHPELDGMYNSRLLESCAVLREIREYAVKHEINTVLFGGDLFHQRGTLNVDVLNATRHEIEQFAAEEIEFIAIPGNHDYADRNGNIHSLTTISNATVVLAELEHRIVMDKYGDYIFVIAIPYTDDILKAKEYLVEAGRIAEKSAQKCVLLAHLGMQGAKVGSDYVLVHDSDISVDDVPYNNFTACLFGHFHQHQQLFKNGWYIGASHQHNWGDANTKRGFLHCKIDDAGKFSFDFIETQSARKFHRLSTAELAAKKSEIRPFDHVAITDVPSMSMARRLEVQLGLETPIVLASEEPDEIDDSEMKLPSLNLKDYVGKWVQYKLNKEDKELENLGMSVLSEAIQEKI